MTGPMVQAAIEAAEIYLGNIAAPAEMTQEEALDFYDGVQAYTLDSIAGLKEDLGL